MSSIGNIKLTWQYEWLWKHFWPNLIFIFYLVMDSSHTHIPLPNITSLTSNAKAPISKPKNYLYKLLEMYKIFQKFNSSALCQKGQALHFNTRRRVLTLIGFLQHNLHERILWFKVYSPIIILQLRSKLATLWNSISKWSITFLGKGIFSFIS